MRRVILAVTGTIAGLVALLSFKSHAPSLSTAAASTGASGSSAASGTGTSQGVPVQGATNLPAGERAITGNVANTVYGPVQVQLVVHDNKIIKVAILEQPESTIHDLQIGQFAFPRLISETIAAQSAKIDAVSGASYTSQGYIQSLQSALDNGV
jgi:FMN-binding domain